MTYKELSKYRMIWLGLAQLWIIVFHYPADLGAFNVIKNLGYCGVDICLFASGLGCFFSLSGNDNVLDFMKRRIKRLYPAYFIFIICWLACQIVTGDFNVGMAIGNVFAIQTFTGLGNAYNWYMAGTFLCYILAPYFKVIVDRSTNWQKAIFVLFLVICTIPFWHAEAYNIATTRVPIFFIGMLFADWCQKNKKVTTKHLVFMIIAFVLGVTSLVIFKIFFKQYLRSCGLYWYPFILITPPLCLAISYATMLLEKTKPTKLIVSFLDLCGDYSFELYLLHIYLTTCIDSFRYMFNPSTKVQILIAVLGAVLLVVGCFVLRRLATWLQKLFTKKQ